MRDELGEYDSEWRDEPTLVDVEQVECVDCGETFDEYALDDQGRCEDCQVDHVWDGLYRLQEQAEQQKRAGLREA